jgi:phage terminase small subunit
MKRKHPQKKKLSLNPRRLDFCKQYLIDFNGTQAAIRSGFAESAAQEQASRLLSNAMVRAEIDRLRKKREDRLEASADFVVRELMRIAKFDIKMAFSDDGSLKDIKSMPADITRCLASVEIKDLFEGTGKDREQVGFTKTIRAWDKIRALEALGEHFGIFKRPGEKDPKEDPKQKRLDLLQVIKLVAKDGQVTTITNRIGEGAEQPSVVAASRPRGLVVVGRTSADSRVDTASDQGK